jgi:hypothetical protein
MTDTKATPRGFNSTAKRCNQQQADAPTSGGDPPDPAHGFKAFRVAYERPGELMDVLELVRKGLQRGKEAAQRPGHSSP